VPPIPLNGLMRGATVGSVVVSKSPKFQPGDHVVTVGGWSEYTVQPADELMAAGTTPGAKITDSLGVLGMTGLTAYFGLLDIGDPKPGELVVVSGAAGATGSVVCQLAKLKGARVVGIAGEASKLQWLREELGCDAALNYKDADFDSQFRTATKGYIDVFFDNVGGHILDMALERAQKFARFVMCGAISQYNSTNPEGPKNITKVIQMRVKMQGFIVMDYASRYGEARKQLAEWLAEGKLKRKETVVPGGLEKAGDTLVRLYTGVNTGKLLQEITPP
jgi:NADPH-dependent curcumin reductase CurA